MKAPAVPAENLESSEKSGDFARRSVMSPACSPTSSGELAEAVRCDLPPGLSRGFAHSLQNFVVGEFSVAQEGQRRVNGDAHSPQNFARSGFSAPHFEQCIGPLLLEPSRS